jgi:hypothetical protein
MQRRKSDKSAPFNFLPIVRDAIYVLTKDDKEKMTQLISQFNAKMANAMRKVENTPGLDMTEAEQLQKIANLEEAIRQKEELIFECQREFESWQASPL